MTDLNLDSHAVPYNHVNWDRYLANTELTAEVRTSIASISDLAEPTTASRSRRGRVIRRRHVREAFTADSIRGIVASIIWGYPRGNLPGGRNFTPVFAQVRNIAEAIKMLKSPIPSATETILSATETCRRLGFVNGMGPSTYTKMAHFAEIMCAEGQCLIYDQRVMRAISVTDEPEFQELARKLGPCRKPDGSFRQYTSALQVETYGDFITAAERLARRRSSTPAHVEYSLFMAAPHGQRN
jgi:hypothetical protein